MRKTWIVVGLLALVASSCSGSGDDEGAPTTRANDTVDNDGSSTTGDEPSESDSGRTGPESANSGPLTIWLPSSLGLDTFVIAALEEAPFDVTVLEEPATYDQTSDAARAALGDGYLALVPASIGEELVNQKAAIFLGRFFEDDDPEAAISQLGVWLIGTADAAGVTIDGANSYSTGASENQITLTALRSVEGPSLTPDAQEVVSSIVAEGKALDDSMRQGKAFEAAGVLVEAAATTYGTRVGGSIAARSVAKYAGPVAVVLDFLKTMHDFTKAAMEMIDAESNAQISLYDTGMAATGMISDAGTRLAELRAAIIAGEVSAEEGQELVSTLQRAITRAASVATDSAGDLEEAGGETGAAQILQLRQRRLDGFFDQARRTIDEIDARPAESQIVIGAGPDRIIDVRGPSGDEPIGKAADILFGTPKANESMHSNGQLTVTSEGETDLIGVGQFFWAPLDGGPGLDDLLPCGQTGDVHTLCGGRDYIGDHTVVLAKLGGMIDFDSNRIYQYAFVFDRDSDSGDNFIAGGSFPYDTWDQSDIRYELSIGNGDYALNVTEGPNFTGVDSGARIHIEGDMIMGVIPSDEIGGSPSDPLVPMRVTTFWHQGNFGLGPDHTFNIDVFPVVHDPYWVPGEVVSLTGPPGAFGGPRPIGSEQLDMFEQYRQGIATGFAGFTPAEVIPDDPTALTGVDECFANEYFFENPTTLVTERQQYEYGGTSIQVRYEAHDSEDAARGTFGFSSSPVSVNCRGALVDSVGIELLGVDRTVSDDTLTVDRYELGEGGSGLFLNVYSTYMDSTFVRVNTSGPSNPELDAMILDALVP